MFSKVRRSATRNSVAALASIALVVAGAVVAPAAGDAPGAPAKVVDYDPPTRLESYRYTDFGRSPSPRDDRTGFARFRVLERTGNCCENYITINRDGTVFDLGGRYINFSDDNGKTWKQVQPIEPLVNGEGTISMAPGGDVIGVEWDPYSGDHLLSYKYEAESKQWFFMEMPLHTPFYDRPWLTVVPGPFSIAGGKTPYVVFVDGFPHRGPYLYSTDGLTYVQTSNPFLDQSLRSVEQWPPTTKSAEMDWILPNSNSPITALGGGYALSAPGPFADSWSLFQPETMSWSALELPDGSELTPRLLVDSQGRIHDVSADSTRLEYRISSDRGKTWKSLTATLPKGHSTAEFDYRVNAALGIAVIGIHANTAEGDQDLLYKLDISSGRPRITRLYEIGKGDVDAAAGLGRDVRFDFETVGIFPDGRLAISFLDSTTGPVYTLTEAITDRLGPALAIEL